jgi:uncharacterized membrane protein YraQ (UPF0718 family)
LGFLTEMVQILPFVLVLTALVSEWIPSETVKRHLGESSKLRGALFAYLLGSVSAGPIYAAFPLCLALKKKGASVRNLTILISTWAVIKIPMLFMELKSLGPRFTLLRYILTLPTIFILGFIIDRLVKPEEMAGSLEESLVKDISYLPGKNCGGCGFKTCEELYKSAKRDGNILRKSCIFLS